MSTTKPSCQEVTSSNISMTAEEIEQKHKKLEELARKYKEIQPNPLITNSRHGELRKGILDNRKRIERFIGMCKAIGVSNKNIQLHLQQLVVVSEELKKIGEEQSQQQEEQQEEGWFIWAILAIPRLIYRTIEILLKSIAYVLSLGVYNSFKKADQEIDQQLESLNQIKERKLQQKQLLEGQIKSEISSKKFLIEEIGKFEKEELPKIEAFLRAVNQIVTTRPNN